MMQVFTYATRTQKLTQKRKTMKRFTDENGNYNLIDKAGNHFINGKCVNPKTTDVGKYIGDTYKSLKLQ